MSEWFCKDCNKDELVDLPNEMHEYLTNCFGNNGRYDSLSAIKIYDFLIEQGLGKVDFLSSEELLSVGFTGPLVDHFCNRADLKKQLGMLDEAIDDCNKAITLDMEWSNAYNTRGTIYYRKGDEFQELKDYEKAVEIDNNGAALTNLGNYYKQKGQFDIAMRYYDQAILLDQDSEVKCWAYTGRGDIFCNQGNYEKGIAEYDVAEKSHPYDSSVYYSRARCFEKQGLVKEAIADYTKAIELAPDEWLLYTCHGDLLADRGEFTAALADYNQAITLNPVESWLYDRRYEIDRAAYRAGTQKEHWRVLLDSLQKLTKYDFFDFLKKVKLINDEYIGGLIRENLIWFAKYGIKNHGNINTDEIYYGLFYSSIYGQLNELDYIEYSLFMISRVREGKTLDGQYLWLLPPHKRPYKREE